LDLFEFILTITSVIYALAVAQILVGISRVAQSTSTIRFFVPHAVWVLTMFVYLFLAWWTTWEFRHVDWTFPKYAYMLIAPTLLFLSCSLLIPQRFDTDYVDLEEHFLRIRRPFFLSYFFATLALVVDGNLLGDEPLWHDARYPQIALLGLAVWAYLSRNKAAQQFIAVASLVAFVMVTAVRFWNPR